MDKVFLWPFEEEKGQRRRKGEEEKRRKKKKEEERRRKKKKKIRGQEGSVENNDLALMDSGFMAEIPFMSITSKSPRAILVTAFEIAADALPAYSHVVFPTKSRH